MSTCKIDVNDLLKDELEFELACRGISNIQTVKSMRPILREIFNKESKGSSVNKVVPSYCTEDPSSQITICQTKFESLKLKFTEVSEKPDKVSCKRIISRVAHLKNRLSLITPAEGESARYDLLVSSVSFLLESVTDLLTKDVEEEGETVLTETDKEILQQTLGQEGLEIIEKLRVKDESSSNLVKNNKLLKSSTLDKDFCPRKLVPVKDWGIKFSGPKGGLSINAFLERVNELKIARNADDDDLWRYAIDLFEGDALIWYRANRDGVSCWRELVDILLLTFQRPYYQDELMDEIRKRTQGKNESVTVYVAVMQNMFNRLPEKLSENSKLSILLKNLQPFFQHAICRDTFESVAQLNTVLRILERTQSNCERFQEPVNSVNLLEPDLAYQVPSPSTIPEVNAIVHNKQSPTGLGASSSRSNTASLKCWNCRMSGHSFRQCRIPRQRIFCYKCGKFGQTTKSCCNNSGNEKTEVVPSAKLLPK